ncbi:MAG: low molecular weight protein arginine phosphatase [Lentisphaerae bacterium]|nr:low molecular weight protein arginine phosphatase [Lentisphaerota bacterium]
MDKILRKSDGVVSVLFICTGNTCRSPMAELIFSAMASGKNITVSSAGLYAFDGEAMSVNSQQALAEAGIDGSQFRSQSVTYDLVEGSSLILTMTASHRAELLMRFPEAADKCFSLAHLSGSGDISDPYGQSLDVYRQTFAEIRKCAAKWLDFLTEEGISKKLKNS